MNYTRRPIEYVLAYQTHIGDFMNVTCPRHVIFISRHVTFVYLCNYEAVYIYVCAHIYVLHVYVCIYIYR